ncbi:MULTISPECIES: hypothetical protein [unclassified Aureimonas]|uniref:hypothetical protein n=1 Tax=unclassified Aureimonas TaxID=2615206 RepID=UPI000A4E29BB|nr:MULTISPECIES: hypothetical protein [unclassified Aureimonas]
MGRSPYGWNDGPGYLGFADAAAYHDHKRRQDRDDVYREELERQDAERARAAREAAE